MVILKRKNFWWVFIFLLFILFGLRLLTQYKQITLAGAEWLAIKQLILVALEICSIGIFLFYTYYFITYFFYQGRSWIDMVLLVGFFFFVSLILPYYIYMNSIMIFANLYALNYNEVLYIASDIQFSDFLQLMMDNKEKQFSVPTTNGHIIVAGNHEGKNYVCLDICQAIDKTFKSSMAKSGAYAAKNVMGVPDVVCSGLEEKEVPKTSSN